MQKRGLKLALNVLIALLCCELFTRVVVSLVQPTMGHTPGFEEKYDLIANIQSPALVIVGDSTADNGIYADYLQQLLAGRKIHLNVYNLASPAQDMYTSFLLLRQLKEGGTPPVILFNASGETLETKNWYEEFKDKNKGNEFLLKSLKAERSYLYRCVLLEQETPAATTYCAAAKHSYLVRYRWLLKGLLSNLLTAIVEPGKDSFAYERKNTLPMTKAGWHPLFNKRTDGKPADAYWPQSRPFEFTEKNATWSLYQWCQSHHMPIVLVRLPYLGAKPDPYFSKSATANKNVYRVDLFSSVTDPALFYDAKHVNAVGAIRLTEALAQKLSQLPIAKP